MAHRCALQRAGPLQMTRGEMVHVHSFLKSLEREALPAGGIGEREREREREEKAKEKERRKGENKAHAHEQKELDQQRAHT